LDKAKSFKKKKMMEQQEPYESRDSRTDLWEGGGAIPLRDPTQYMNRAFFLILL
jgi:hypothetical protein